MIDYYSGVARRFGGEVKARYRNAICLVLDEDNIIEYDGDDIGSEVFLISHKAHPTRINGFPLDSISIDVNTRKYYLDISEAEKNKEKSKMSEACKNFFSRAILKE